MRSSTSITLAIFLVSAPAVFAAEPADPGYACAKTAIFELCPPDEPVGEPATVLAVLTPMPEPAPLGNAGVPAQFHDASRGTTGDVDPLEPTNRQATDDGWGPEDQASERGQAARDDRSEERGDNRDRDGDGGEAPPAPVPCSDQSIPTVGCPDLLVDPTTFGPIISRETFGEGDCAVQEGQVAAGQRRLMRFTFTSPNFGDGDLIVGAPGDHPEWFEFSDCHGHYHFREYADYRLWTPDGYVAWRQARLEMENATPEEVFEEHPELLDGFVTGHKQGFCVVDVRPYIPLPRRYTSCSTHQGIQVGWADQYSRSLDGQWVDITDVEPGQYVLEAEVNPERLFVETDYENNAGAALVNIPQE